MEVKHQRIERAWQDAKGWITDFDGTPSQTFYPAVSNAVLADALLNLAGQGRQFRLAILRSQGAVEIPTVSSTEVSDLLAQLEQEEGLTLNADYTVGLDGFDLDLHGILESVEPGRTDVVFLWWGDQAFPDDTDYAARFAAMAHYFIQLQELLQAKHVYVSPENPEAEDAGGRWIEL